MIRSSLFWNILPLAFILLKTPIACQERKIKNQPPTLKGLVRAALHGFPQLTAILLHQLLKGKCNFMLKLFSFET